MHITNTHAYAHTQIHTHTQTLPMDREYTDSSLDITQLNPVFHTWKTTQIKAVEAIELAFLLV